MGIHSNFATNNVEHSSEVPSASLHLKALDSNDPTVKTHTVAHSIIQANESISAEKTNSRSLSQRENLVFTYQRILEMMFRELDQLQRDTESLGKLESRSAKLAEENGSLMRKTGNFTFFVSILSCATLAGSQLFLGNNLAGQEIGKFLANQFPSLSSPVNANWQADVKGIENRLSILLQQITQRSTTVQELNSGKQQYAKTFEELLQSFVASGRFG